MNVKEKYSKEISGIEMNLKQIEQGRFKELTGANYDGLLATKIEQLRTMFNDLIYKIENDIDSDKERLSKRYKEVSKKL